MDETRDGFRKFLETQVEAFQERLYDLERDPEQVDYLKSILRVCQRLRHASDAEEPEPVRILRNAVEKVTLHLGRSNLAVSQDFLDFYVDTFDLLEESIRRWPAGPAFDRARYADRVRALLATTAPRRGVGYGGDAVGAGFGLPPERVSRTGAGRRGAVMAEESVGPDVADEIVLTEPERADSVAGAGGTAERVETAAEAVPTWREREPGPSIEEPAPSPEGGAAPLTEAPRVEVLRAEDLSADEREAYMEADLRDLLGVPRAKAAEAATGWSAPGAAPMGATLAASFSTFETLREPVGLGDVFAPSRVGSEAESAVHRLRDVLDRFSIALNDLDLASDRLLREEPAALGRHTVSALVERLEVEKEKLLSVFDRTIDAFRAGAL